MPLRPAGGEGRARTNPWASPCFGVRVEPAAKACGNFTGVFVTQIKGEPEGAHVAGPAGLGWLFVGC